MVVYRDQRDGWPSQPCYNCWTDLGGLLIQGCQMAYFPTKNPNFGKFWRALEWKMLVYFMANWYNLWPFSIVCCHFVIFSHFWYVWTKQKSGNPGLDGME
jgi:hypothetical protein